MQGLMAWMCGVRLPGLHAGATGAPGLVARRPGGEPATEEGDIRSKRMVILVVDGCIISSVAQAFESLGYEISRAQGLTGALACIAHDRPSLIVVCGLPVVDTYRALRRATGTPILALLTRAEEGDVLDILEAGADDCQPASIGKLEVLKRGQALLRRAGW